MIRLVRDFLIATMATFILASLAHSQFVLHELAALGVSIDFATRWSTSLDDLIGLLPGYGGIIAIALLIAFIVISWTKSRLPGDQYWLYPLGGFLAILVAHLAMYPIFHITLIAGAREPFGLFCQALAGAFGGWAFASMRQRVG